MKPMLISLTLLFSPLSFSAEADNFTARTLTIFDISEELNIRANNYLKLAVEKVNKEGSCDQSPANEQKLYTELAHYFSNHSKGQLIKDILYTDDFKKNSLPLKKSVYGEWSPMNGYLLGRKKAVLSPLALSPLIKIGDQIIGVDKIEHMFGMGLTYFSQFSFKEKSISKILKKGILKEKTFLGGNFLATGVFSYADLSANFNGMRFWNHVLLKQDDILGSEHNLGPYISCVDKKWKVEEKNPLDFRNYIDSSMDESINCSKFATRNGEKKFRRALIRLNFVSVEGQPTCPVEPEKLKDLEGKYSPLGIAHFIINDEGLGQVSYFNEF